MEAPVKLYLSKIIYGTYQYQVPDPDDDTQVEYVRKDAFVEKVVQWLNQHYRDYMYNPTGKRLEAFFGMDMIGDLEEYIEE